jgi:hypothetical protein
MNCHAQKDWLDRAKCVVGQTEKKTFDLLQDDSQFKSGHSREVIYNIHQKAHHILMAVKTYF